jgi:hypothetical protein
MMLIGFAGLGVAGYRAPQKRAATLPWLPGTDDLGAVRLIRRY